MSLLSGSTVGTGSAGGEAPMGRDEESGRREGHSWRLGKTFGGLGWRNKQALCSLRTHDYCMGEAQV